VITAVTTQQFVQKHSQQHLLTWSESLLHTFDVAQWNCTDTFFCSLQSDLRSDRHIIIVSKTVTLSPVTVFRRWRVVIYVWC